MTVKKGDKVKIDYEGRLEDGEVFDSSKKHNKPMEIEVGSGQVIPGFEKALMGMKKGEEKEIKLKPSEAYGDHNPQLIQNVPRDRFPKEGNLKDGVMVLMSLPDGNQIPAKVVKVSKDSVKLDFNHPLAGKTLIFKIKVIEISR